MAPTNRDYAVPEDVDQLSGDELREQHPLVRLFGDGARVRIVMALANAKRPLNPAAIQDVAGIHHDTWYRHRDDLLDTGLMVEAGSAGNSPLYALADREEDIRVEALEMLTAGTAAYRRDGEPIPPE